MLFLIFPTTIFHVMKDVLRQTLEREVKLKTGRAFRLLPFPGEPLPPRLFTSTYFDPVDFVSEPCLPETIPFPERFKTILHKQRRDM